MKTSTYVISALIVGAVALAAVAACERSTPVDPLEEQLAVAGGSPIASAPAVENSEPDVLYACYNPSGSVYRIREPGLKDECTGANHVEFSWSEQGQQGAKGDKGDPGDFTGHFASPNGRFSLDVTDDGIVLAGPGGSVKITDALVEVEGVSAVNVKGARVTLNGACKGVARVGDPVAGGHIVGGSNTVFVCS